MTRASTLILALLACGLPGRSEEAPRLDAATQEKLKGCIESLAAAQKAEDEPEVKRLANRWAELLGDQAGLPEEPDEFRPIPESARPLSREEIATAFDPFIDQIKAQKWWKVGLDPTKTSHPLRELAAVIEGCLAARAVNEPRSAELLAIARDAGDFLVWAQEQAGTGVIPFPAVRNGKGRAFETSERFLKKAEQAGRLGDVVKNGWVVEDVDSGGLQFDNGLAGVALAHLFDATGDDAYRKAATRAAEWARKRPVVPNWNYNSFSVFLLAEVRRLTGEDSWLEAAKTKTRLGVLPGQLTAGPRAGRWADFHNAKPAYHYIMIRALAALAAALPKDDLDLPALTESLRLALSARNPDFKKGVVNVESAVEALIQVQSLPPRLAAKLPGCGTDEALDTLERYAAAGFRAGKGPLGPGAWGQLLANRKVRMR